MSIRSSRPASVRRIAELALLVAGLAAMAPAFALKSDADQPVGIDAQKFSGRQGDKVTYSVAVHMTQGSFVADGDTATGYFDKNDAIDRAVLTGKPAKVQQKLDDGSMMYGHADTIDYQVGANTVILTGNASIVQTGKGEYHGARLVYNTDSGQVSGEGGAEGRVHMILQPKKKPAATPAPAASAAPAPASSTATPAAAGGTGPSGQPR